MMDALIPAVIYSGSFMVGFALGFLVIGPAVAWLFNL